jgi:hypothetical protein
MALTHLTPFHAREAFSSLLYIGQFVQDYKPGEKNPKRSQENSAKKEPIHNQLSVLFQK